MNRYGSPLQGSFSQVLIRFITKNSFTVSYVDAIFQQIYLQFCCCLEISVLLIKFWHSIRVIVRLSVLLILELRFCVCCHPCFFLKFMLKIFKLDGKWKEFWLFLKARYLIIRYLAFFINGREQARCNNFYAI